jgi:hypothetical protein
MGRKKNGGAGEVREAKKERGGSKWTRPTLGIDQTCFTLAQRPVEADLSTASVT